MTHFGPQTYGDSFADVYDQWYGQVTDAQATAAFVSRRALPGPILELGVGTGRLAIPLVERGHDVVGLDASPIMLAKCPRSVTPVLADMADLPFTPSIPAGNNRPATGFGAALCAFNTLFNLPSARAQGRFLNQVAQVLAPGAPLVIEAITGSDLIGSGDSSLGVSRIEPDKLVLSATMVDHTAQTITGQHVDITEEGIKMRPWLLRWTTPSQLDELAQEAGLKLFERYADWTQGSFSTSSELAISVYIKA